MGGAGGAESDIEPTFIQHLPVPFKTSLKREYVLITKSLSGGRGEGTCDNGREGGGEQTGTCRHFQRKPEQQKYEGLRKIDPGIKRVKNFRMTGQKDQGRKDPFVKKIPSMVRREAPKQSTKTRPITRREGSMERRAAGSSGVTERGQVWGRKKWPRNRVKKSEELVKAVKVLREKPFRNAERVLKFANRGNWGKDRIGEGDHRQTEDLPP